MSIAFFNKWEDNLEKRYIFHRKPESLLTIIGSISSVIAIILLAFKDAHKANIALVLFAIFLIVMIVRAFIFFKNYLKCSYPKGYSKISTFYRYTTIDAKFIEYENYKHIQCKAPFLTEHEHGFHWTGDKKPKISSTLQTIDKKIIQGGDGDYDRVFLKFKNPLLYNEIGLIHMFMQLDDSNQKSETYLDSKIIEPIQMIQFHIELMYKPNDYNEPARILRKSFKSNIPCQYEQIEQIQFEQRSKSYRHTLINPEVGYFYRIEWDR
jgi:hypothetical protein